MITSTANPQVKYLIQLQKKRSLRKKDGVFVVEGIKMAMEIPEGLCKKLYVSESFAESVKKDRERSQISEWLNKREHEVLADHVFESCAETQSPQGVLAIVGQAQHKEAQFIRQQADAMYLLLDGIQDPGNLGTILRTAEAVGAHGVIMSADTVDIYNPKVVRSTMGAIFRVPYFYTEDLPAFIQKQRKCGIRVFATALEDSVDYAICDYKSAVSFVIGNEANGIRPETKQASDQMIHIPMLGHGESLNAAVATAVVAYEAYRQRRNAK